MYTDGKKVDSDYNYVGLYIQNWSTGTKAAMYRFEAVDKNSDAPAYIVFNDHMIEPAAAAAFPSEKRATRALCDYRPGKFLAHVLPLPI